MLENVPEADRPKDMAHFWQTVALELTRLMEYGSKAEQPQIWLKDVRKVGSQYLWEFWVNDLAIPRRDAYNWHGQNVSQWKYAGAIVLQDGDVSAHH